MTNTLFLTGLTNINGHPVTVTINNENRAFIEYSDPNTYGDRLSLSVTLCEVCYKKNYLGDLWRKSGKLRGTPSTYWSIDDDITQPSDFGGRCHRSHKVNPTYKPGGAGYVVNFDYIREATQSSLLSVLSEITENFYNAVYDRPTW
jgi:hypothetical protein